MAAVRFWLDDHTLMAGNNRFGIFSDDYNSITMCDEEGNPSGEPALRNQNNRFEITCSRDENLGIYINSFYIPEIIPDGDTSMIYVDEQWFYPECPKNTNSFEYVDMTREELTEKFNELGITISEDGKTITKGDVSHKLIE